MAARRRAQTRLLPGPRGSHTLRDQRRGDTRTIAWPAAESLGARCSRHSALCINQWLETAVVHVRCKRARPSWASIRGFRVSQGKIMNGARSCVSGHAPSEPSGRCALLLAAHQLPWHVHVRLDAAAACCLGRHQLWQQDLLTQAARPCPGGRAAAAKCQHCMTGTPLLPVCAGHAAGSGRQ